MRAQLVVLACSSLALGACSILTATDPDDIRVRRADGGIVMGDDGSTCGAEICGNRVDDDCDGLIDVGDPDCGPAPGDHCGGGAALSVGVSVVGDTTGLADDVRLGCAQGESGQPDAVYTLRTEGTIDLAVDTFGSSFDTVLGLRRTCDRLEDEIACSNDANATGASQIIYRHLGNGDYTVIVDGDRDRGAGAYSLNVHAQGSPEQLQCENAIDVSRGAAVFGRTGGEDRYSGSCGGAGSPEEVFTFTLAEPSNVVMHTISSRYDTVLYVRTLACFGEASLEVACNDDAGGMQSSQIELRPLPPGTYYVFVDGFGGAAGEYLLIVHFEAA